MVTYCSVGAPETLPHARVLAAALSSWDPAARIVVCVPDPPPLPATPEPFELLAPANLVSSLPAAERDGAGGLSQQGLPAALLEWALADGADVAVYLAPHVCVYGSLGPALEQARAHAVALVSRVGRLPDDDQRPNYSDLLVAGRISPSFVAASGEEGRRFARWWRRRASDGAGARWLELAREEFPGALTLDDPGLNVSYWNLHERHLTREGDTVLVDGRPLRSFEFAGFRPDRPYVLAGHPTRVNPIDDPVLAELCGDYAERLLDAGWRAPAAKPTGGEERLGNGLPMDPLLRTLWAQAGAAGQGFSDPASPLDADAFTAWLREPAADQGAPGINRYLFGVYQSRPDLQQAFPELDESGGAGLIAWAWQHGRQELALHPELLPARSNHAGPAEDARLTVNVVGYLRDTLGLAEAARLYISALSAAGVPVTTTAVAPDLPLDLSRGKTVTRFGHRPYEELRVPFEPAFNLVCLNGDQLDAFARAGGEELLDARVTIGNWGWETDVLPPSWLAGFKYVDEIWVYSRFVAENLGRVSPVPVVVIPQAITVPDVSGVDVDLIRDDRFTFLFMFDFFSTLKRKNPLGLIEAFKRAFAPDEGPRLLLKTINEKFRPKAAAMLRSQIGDRRDIDLVDRYLEPREIAALVARASCYVSLHRSEGFGLTLADAMALGTPVIATAYSGNLDFTTERNSFLVDWTPTHVGEDSDHYPPEGTWAEPDLDHAAELMRRVWQDPAGAAEKAARARLDIERSYAPAVTGRVARARLESLLEQRRERPRREFSHALSMIEQELRLDLRRGAPSRRRASALLRRAVMRLMLPFTLHERSLDRAILEALRELRLDLERERAQGAGARQRLQRLEQRLLEASEPQA